MASYQLTTTETGKILHIRSLDIPTTDYITPGLTTDFWVNLESPIICQDNEHLIMALDSLSVPMVFYNIDETTNKFIFIENSVSAGVLTIPVGNYSMKSLASTLETLLTGASPSGKTYTVAYGSFKNTLTFTVAPSTPFTLDFNTPNPAFTQLGFAEDSINSSTGGVLVSTNSCSLIKYLSLFVCTDLNIGTSLNTQGQLSNVLERVGITQANTLLYYRPTTTMKKFLLKDKVINRFRVRLLFDLADTPVNLRGLHFEMSLQFHVVGGLERPLADKSKPEYPVIEAQSEAQETTFGG